MQIRLVQASFVLVWLGSWELAARLKWVDPVFTSMPSQIARALWRLLGEQQTYTDIRYTLSEAAVGYALGVLLGGIFGALMGVSTVMRSAFQPILSAFNAIPRIALAPLFVAWFGLGMQPRIVMALTIVFFVMASAMTTALSNPDKDMTLLAKSLGVGRLLTLRKFVLPGAVPILATALELSLVYTFLGVIAAEIVSGSYGLGTQMTQAANLFQPADFFALLVILTVIVTVLTVFIRLIERRILTWHRHEMIS